MECYINKFCKIEVVNGYYYKGNVIDVDSENITLIDIHGKSTTLSRNIIVIIREVDK